MKTLASKNIIDHYLTRFDSLKTNRESLEPAWLSQIRKESLALFAQNGFPTTENELWRFTNISPLANIPFGEPHSIEENRIRENLAKETALYLPGIHLVFINGIFSKTFSSFPKLPSGMKVENLAAVLARDPAWLEPYFAQKGSYEDQPFAALNTAFTPDGVGIYIPKGVVVHDPIHLIFYQTSEKKPIMVSPRILIVAGRESKATIVENYLGAANEAYFTNAVVEMNAGENSSLDHYTLQRESEAAYHIATTHVHLDRDCRFSACNIALGGALVRNNLNIYMDGEGIDCSLSGLYMIRNRQHVDNHLRVEHAQPNCTSSELYKGILDHQSRGVFHGKIHVHPHAQKTNAKQTNMNLLLSNEAEVNTMPQLEIYADDVKCTHGATIGRLEENELFYLRSRGIDVETARNLLTFAFASDIVRRIRVNEIRSQIDRLLFTRLPKCHVLDEELP